MPLSTTIDVQQTLEWGLSLGSVRSQQHCKIQAMVCLIRQDPLRDALKIFQGVLPNDDSALAILKYMNKWGFAVSHL